jgi:hypothetical protein
MDRCPKRLVLAGLCLIGSANVNGYARLQGGLLVEF